MQKNPTKTFIGGITIGIILGAIITNIIACNLYINNYELQILSEIRDTLNVSTCYQVYHTTESVNECVNYNY